MCKEIEFLELKNITEEFSHYDINVKNRIGKHQKLSKKSEKKEKK